MSFIELLTRTINIKYMQLKSYILNLFLGKITNKGERFDPRLGKIIGYTDQCHKERYEFAKKVLKNRYVEILDIASGLGYGTSVLVTSSGIKYTGVDNSESAIKYARSNYGKSMNIKFVKSDFFKYNKKHEVVISFETLEHIKVNSLKVALKHLFSLANKIIICSVPYNEPVDNNQHHHFFNITKQTILDNLPKEKYKKIIKLYYQLANGTISDKPNPLPQNLLFVIKKK